MNCRHCNNYLTHVFLDLGYAPPSNAYISEQDMERPEKYYPLKLYVCENCWLVQTDDYAEADELFGADYAYFSSVSTSWLSHASKYCEMITKRLSLGQESFVIEVASNDGYLLKNFVAEGIPCLGIEPTASTAAAAEKLGIPVLREFFGESLGQKLADEGKQADLILGNNVFAHVPFINDFTAGLKLVLKKSGTLTLEFPHLMQLIINKQFDTVYHEHFSYLDLGTVVLVFEKVGLRIFDVEELPTHGGSLRVYGCHQDDARKTTNAVTDLLKLETEKGLNNLEVYQQFQRTADKVKDDLVYFLIEQKRAGKRVEAYGAAAKGNTLLNYGGVKPDLLRVVYDAAPSKQDNFMPGSHIPILNPDKISQSKPDFLLILPWNIAPEIEKCHSYIRDWGGKFVTAVPEIRVF